MSFRKTARTGLGRSSVFLLLVLWACCASARTNGKEAKLSARVETGKKTYELGEGVELHVTITNESPQPQVLFLSGCHQFAVSVSPNSGTRRRWCAPRMTGEVFGQTHRLAARESWNRTLLLNRWALVLRPGEYTAKVSFTPDLEPGTRTVKAQTKVRVVPTTKIALVRRMDCLVQTHGLARLSGIGQPEAIPYLVRYLRHKSVFARQEAVNGLRDIMTLEAMDEIAKVLATEEAPDDDSGMRLYAARALASVDPKLWSPGTIETMQRVKRETTDRLLRSVLDKALTKME